jgi:hypothetical protein
MPTLREQAEALARALEVGAVFIDDAVAWADAQVEASDKPPWAIIEVATARSRHPQDLAGELRQVQGPCRKHVVQGLLVDLMARRLASDPRNADAMANALFDMALGNEIRDEPLQSFAFWAWDALDLADAGIIAETRAEIVDQMRAELARVVEQTPVAERWPHGFPAR